MKADTVFNTNGAVVMASSSFMGCGRSSAMAVVDSGETSRPVDRAGILRSSSSSSKSMQITFGFFGGGGNASILESMTRLMVSVDAFDPVDRDGALVGFA